MSTNSLRPEEIQVRPCVTSRVNKQPFAKVLLYPMTSAVKDRLDADFGVGCWSWECIVPDVWTLRTAKASQSVPVDYSEIKLNNYTANTYNKVLLCRAARSLGYGRELETSPEIKIFQDDEGSFDFVAGSERWEFREKLSVREIESQNGTITKLVIIRDKDGRVVFKYEDKSVGAAVGSVSSAPAATSSQPAPAAQAPVAEAPKKPRKKKEEPKPLITEVSEVPVIPGMSFTAPVAKAPEPVPEHVSQPETPAPVVDIQDDEFDSLLDALADEV